jgi:hypothetical protein
METDKRINPVTPSPCHPVTLSPCHTIILLLVVFTLAGCTAAVVVEWSTETEINTAGFNLYRGTAITGPFDVKVNEQLIPASPDPVTGGKYNYVDRTAQTGVMYYYQLQEVEKTGAVNRYGPIAVRASGLDWRLAAVLGGLAAGVVALWLAGGRQVIRKIKGADKGA